MNEKPITKDLVEIAGAEKGTMMYGLDFACKTGSSVADKIARKKEDHPDESDADIVRSMGDLVRYTALTGHDNIPNETNRMIKELNKRGYEIEEVDNKYLDKGSDYHGVHISAKDPRSGQVFELQVHSKESMAVKEQLHPMYEKSRATDCDPKVKKTLHYRMKNLSAGLPDPKGLIKLRILRNKNL